MTAASVPLPPAPPTRRQRVTLAAVIAITCAVFTWFQHDYLLRRTSAPDSLYLWRAANCALDGANPWQTLSCAPTHGGAVDPGWTARLNDPLYYPMPAVVAWMPLARLPYLVASVLFNALGAFLFVFAVTRTALHRAWACGSVPFMIAMRFGQWSPWLVAAALLPGMSALLVAKPNVGLPLYVSRPTWRASVACAAALLVPTLVAPWWVGSWMHNVRADLGHTAPHPAPVTMFAGAGLVLLLALLRWRRQEARLVLVMACLPQLPYWADQLPLLLVAESRREVQGMMLATLLGFTAWMLVASQGGGDFVDTMRPYAVLGTYGPALLLVLRRRNEGAMPLWLERGAGRLPAWLRGTPGEARSDG